MHRTGGVDAFTAASGLSFSRGEGETPITVQIVLSFALSASVRLRGGRS